MILIKDNSCPVYGDTCSCAERHIVYKNTDNDSTFVYLINNPLYLSIF